MVIVMAITTITLFFAVLGFVVYDVINFRKKISDELQTLAEIIASNNTGSISFMDAEAASESLLSLQANKHIVGACIYLKNGNSFATFKKNDSGEEIIFPLSPSEGIFFSTNYLEVVKKVQIKNEPIGLIYIKSDLNELYEGLKSFLWISFFILITALAIAFFITVRLQSVISKPILKLAGIAKELGLKKDYSVRVIPKGYDEIGILFQGFNDMVSQIEKQNEELTGAKKIAENSVKTKEIFLANMSHEIRTPMNAIVGFTGLLLSSNPNREQKEYLDAINTAGKNLLVIINDILDFSKMQSGKMVFEKIEFRLSHVISTIIELMLPKSMEKNIKLSGKIDKTIFDYLIGDPTRLNQILLNLVGNAIKFTEEGEVKMVVDLINETGHSVDLKFSVSDTGIGIPGNKLSTIFEEFTQASSETTRKYGGTGLGLTIVKELVEIQGGDIFVESKEGVGTSFIFNLSFMKGSLQTGIEKMENPDGNLSSIKNVLNILLVEDNPQNQLLAKKVLMNRGWNVDVAENGKVCLQKLKEKNYDIILMDIQMPEMDGYEATRIIRKVMPPPISSTPIMAMTAHAMSDEQGKCLDAGMSGYISKPFEPKVLYAKIESLIRDDMNSFSTGATKENSPSRIPFESKPKNEIVKHSDLTYLKEIANGSNQFVTEMISLFIEQTPPALEEIEKNLQNKNWQALSKIVHKIKPSVTMVGLKEIEEVVVALENSSQKETDLELIPGWVAQIKTVCLKGMGELKDELNKFQ